MKVFVNKNILSVVALFSFFLLQGCLNAKAQPSSDSADTVTTAQPSSSNSSTDTSSSAEPAATASGSSPAYKVEADGITVDAFTYEGFATWRAAACDRCHGPNQEGSVGPSLLNSLKVLTKEDFTKTLMEGRVEKGMPSWNTNKRIIKNMDNLYAYLKGRSDGAIKKARVKKAK